MTSEMMTAERRAELRKLCDAATSGPWRYRPDPFDDWGIVRGPDDYVVAVARYQTAGLTEDQLNQHRRNRTDPAGPDALLIVAARTALPEALDTIEAQAAEIERLKKERDEAQRDHTDMMWQRRRAEEQCEDVEAECAHLREALRVADELAASRGKLFSERLSQARDRLDAIVAMIEDHDSANDLDIDMIHDIAAGYRDAEGKRVTPPVHKDSDTTSEGEVSHG